MSDREHDCDGCGQAARDCRCVPGAVAEPEAAEPAAEADEVVEVAASSQPSREEIEAAMHFVERMHDRGATRVAVGAILVEFGASSGVVQ